MLNSFGDCGHSFGFRSPVQGNDSSGEVSVFNISPTGLLDALRKRLLARPVENRFREVVVGLRIRGHKRRKRRQGRAEVEVIERSERFPRGRRELVDNQGATGANNAKHLPQGQIRVIDVTQAVRDGHRIKRAVRKGQGCRIAGNEVHVGLALLTDGDHADREVERNGLRPSILVHLGGRAGSGRNIKDLHTGGNPQGLADSRPPYVHLPHGQNGIGDVVTLGDIIEHTRHIARVFLQGGSTHISIMDPYQVCFLLVSDLTRLFAFTRQAASRPSPGDIPHPRKNLMWVTATGGMVGWGEAAVGTFEGPDRFTAAQRWFDDIIAAAIIDDPVARPGTGLTAFGTFSFSDTSADISTVTIPQRILGWDSDGAWETVISTDQNATITAEPIEPIGDFGHVDWSAGHLDEEGFNSAVAETVELLARGEAKKVVLARDIDIVSEFPMDERLLVAKLTRAFPSTWTYLVSGMIGATPEMLASVRDGHLTTRVLAGSWPTTQGQEAAEYALRSSAKDIAEHRYASDSVLHALDIQASGPVRANGPTILHLPNVVHLATDFEADLAAGWTGLTAAGAMHPTAAVGGTPTDTALEVIDRIEALDRGRYAAPVGWMDSSGNSDWALALRCAQLDRNDPHRARAFAGGGIMERSVPQQELAETEAKFSAILKAFE